MPFEIEAVGLSLEEIENGLGQRSVQLNEGFIRGIPGVSHEWLGTNVLSIDMATNTSYVARFSAWRASVTLAVRSRSPADGSMRLARYLDRSTNGGMNFQLTILTNSIITLAADSNGDGTYDQVIAPDIDVSGDAASDTEPPTITPVVRTEGNHAIISAHVEDALAGVRNVYYSLDGEIASKYGGSFSVGLDQLQRVSFFADDKAGNRTGLVPAILAPELHVEIEGVTLRLSWRGTYQLEQTDNLNSAQWRPSVAPIVLIDTTSAATVELSDAHKFFRLRQVFE
jgi:hypothetical protein